MNDIAVIITPSAIIANGIYEGKRRHVSISKNTQSIYEKAINAYKEGNNEEILRIGDIATNIEIHSNGLFFVKNGQVYTQNLQTPAPKILSERIIKFSKENIPVEPLVRFWENLENNVSEKVQKQLYTFLEHNNIPLTKDGCFIAYKSVTVGKDGNLWDSYTYNSETGNGTYRNNVGDVVSMPREEVNDDPCQTCSRGLHAAAFDYAVNTYGSWTSGVGKGQKLIHVKIDPKNVVSVPNDYNGQKMRVCEYKVVDTSEDYKPIEDQIYEDETIDEDLKNEILQDMYEDEVDNLDRSDILEELAEGIDEIEDEEDIYDSEEDDDGCTSEYVSMYVKPRYDGRLEIPKLAIVESGLLNKQVTVDVFHGLLNEEYISIAHDNNGDRILREGFRIPASVFKDANMVHNEYLVECTARGNEISISLV